MNYLDYFKKYSMLLIGSFMFLILLFFSFFGEYLPFVDNELKEVKYIWNDKKIPIAPPFEPSDRYILGSDRMGRDVFSLIIMGAKETLITVGLITLFRYIIAIPLAYCAHKKIFGAESLVKMFNVTFAYIPTIIIIVLFVTLPPLLTIDSRNWIFLLILAAVEVGRVANMVKIEFESISTKEFIQGGISVGVSSFRLLFKYYLPFIYQKLIINMVTDLGKVMFLLGQLGFIGIFLSQKLVQLEAMEFEIQNDSITWPTFFMNSFNDIRSAIWIPFFPALAITYSILTFNVLAQGLQNITKKNANYFNAKKR
jgi:peptide/nickel transport system permease protein